MNSNKFSKKYIFVNLPAINSRGDELYDLLQEEAIYSICDIILLGVVPGNLRSELSTSLMENIKKWCTKDCRVISITSAAFKGYFPQHTENRNYECDENEIPIARYFAWGDKNINKLYKLGLSTEKIIHKIVDTSFYGIDWCRRYFENEFKILEKAEEKCDVKIADYLRNIYDKTIAYYSWTHPIPIVLIEIARRIALVLEIEEDFAGYKDEKFLEMKTNEEIVYPSVLKALGLYDEEHLKRRIMPGHMLFMNKRLSTEEYISKYIEYVLNNRKGDNEDE